MWPLDSLGAPAARIVIWRVSTRNVEKAPQHCNIRFIRAKAESLPLCELRAITSPSV